MEKVAANFWRLNKLQSTIVELVAEAARICKLPNWWHPDSGGPDYIYHSLIGQSLVVQGVGSQRHDASARNPESYRGKEQGDGTRRSDGLR
jgi:hypothetical protein